jgi:hypothetical protein
MQGNPEDAANATTTQVHVLISIQEIWQHKAETT